MSYFLTAENKKFLHALVLRTTTLQSSICYFIRLPSFARADEYPTVGAPIDSESLGVIQHQDGTVPAVADPELPSVDHPRQSPHDPALLVLDGQQGRVGTVPTLPE